MIRILCDRCVDQKYVNAFEEVDWITVIEAGDVFPDDAKDTDDGVISAYAEQHEWVVFILTDTALLNPQRATGFTV